MFGTASLLLRRAHKPLFVLPLLVGGVVARVDLAGGISAHIRYRDTMEVVALWVLGSALLLALINAARHRSGPCLWVAALMFSFFARELHFTGTSNGVVVALLLLITVLVRRSGSWQSTLNSRRFATPLVTSFLCYFCSQSMDQRWWRIIPNESVWHTPVEETLEVLGHCFSLLLAWLTPGAAAGAAAGSGASAGASGCAGAKEE
ncbi:MAG: hypothetical protein DRQ55_11990 [Planctomycetota bacterium]|nr:MAG: hypothetical protein DRQ55_11990 [Planctomycetota bacterium]